MIEYLDASALVKRYVEEAGSEHAATWLGHRPCATSRWTQIEILSAVARRCREGSIAPDEREAIAAALEADLSGLFVVEVTPEVIATAKPLLMRHALRSGDAIQLASAQLLGQRTGDRMCFRCFDLRLSAAARAEGMDVVAS